MASRFSRRDFLPTGLKTDHVELCDSTIRIHAHSCSGSAVCPLCGTASRHVHSRYRRRPADLPAHGRKVELVLLVRRFRCRAMHCPARIFAERFPSHVTRPYARRTSRLQGLVRHLGLALGGRPAQALAGRLLLPVSKDTFLRSVRAATEEPAGSPRVVGIDDWAWRKGQRYGTLICDLERRQLIDLLPDREPATVEAWLRARPEIEIVARDRNGGYGGAVARALPGAVQVADRWHLLENASAAFLAAVQRNMPAIRKAIGVKTLDLKLLTAAERLQFEGFQRRPQTNRMVRQMADDRTPVKRIVRLTGLSRGLVRQILRGEREDVFRIRESSLTPWLPRLEREWNDGCRNGAELWRRLRADGFRGSLRVVGEWATRQRRAEQAVPSGTCKSPPARQPAEAGFSIRGTCPLPPGFGRCARAFTENPDQVRGVAKPGLGGDLADALPGPGQQHENMRQPHFQKGFCRWQGQRCREMPFQLAAADAKPRRNRGDIGRCLQTLLHHQ